ncbi:hypothetical protein CN941_26495 [Bacillus cereus]|nr:hypothetical protein CN527_31060 [Bacillus cereus]PFA23248.1 hypothetical protein CN390_30385 [Bacillus cereus]PFE59028.1 hypothetical protein CN316_29220 [Bacillus cereus]PGL28802.1 hypothetical protein CN930_29460 [Bacillus cereus]PGM32763.1 hypothetical protein CN941_26495 [Bacillus cereus]
MQKVQLFIVAVSLFLITGCAKMDATKIEEELRGYDKKISLHPYSDRGLSYEKRETLENMQFLDVVIHGNDAFHNLSHNEKVKVLTDWKKEIDNQTLNTSFDCGDLTCSFDHGSVLVKDKTDSYSFSFKSADTVMKKNDERFEHINSKEEEASETFYYELNQKMEWFVLSLYNFKLRGYPFSYEEPYQKKKSFTRSFDEIVRYSDKIHELMVQTKQENLIETSKRIQNYTLQYKEVYQPLRNKNKEEMKQLDTLTYEIANELLVIAKAFPNPNMMDEKGKEFKNILTKRV